MEQEVERYRTPTRALHWVHTTAFIILGLTGLVLFIPGLGFLAADSYTRVIHRVAAVIFIIGPLIYIPFNLKASIKGIKEAFTWGREDLDWLQAAPRYYFLADEEAMPPQGHMNTGQKMWWLMVIFFGVVFIITGLIMWALKETAPLFVLRWAVFAHDVAFIATGTMFFVHLYLGVIHPLMRPMRIGAWNSMAHGKVSAHYAKSHHRKWYDEVVRSEEGPKEKEKIGV